MATRISDEDKAVAAFDSELEDHNLEGHWRLTGTLTAEPAPSMEPHLWRWEVIYRNLLRAGDMRGIEGGASRRTLRLCTPGLPFRATTPTFQTSIQLVKPSEIATAHRHTMTAFRFVLKGAGGFTTVEGEKFTMEPGDLVLTPLWTWHDHGNDTDEAMVWIDGHDHPFVQSLNACFFQPFHAPQQEVTRPPGHHNRRAGAVRPAGMEGSETGIPYVYKGREVRAQLDQLTEADRDPCDGLTLEYRNPVTGGPTLATIACRMHRLAAGDSAEGRRQTANTVYHVLEGAGESRVGDRQMAWGPGDTFVVPGWAWLRHRVTSPEPAVLFSVRDDPIFRPFGLYRCEYTEDQTTGGPRS